MDQMETDLRKWKCGGWETSKMTVKVNGRWAYIYNTSTTIPSNVKEPISLGAGYRPPNHRNEHFETIPKPKFHPLRTLSLNQRAPYQKAPLHYYNQSSTASSTSHTKSRSVVNNEKHSNISKEAEETNNVNNVNFVKNIRNNVEDVDDDVNNNNNDEDNVGISSHHMINIPFWINEPQDISDIRAKTALDSRIKKRECCRLNVLHRTEKKSKRPMTSDFTRSDNVSPDIETLTESKRLSRSMKIPRKNIFFVC